jgi:hypothetical protein
MGSVDERVQQDFQNVLNQYTPADIERMNTRGYGLDECAQGHAQRSESASTSEEKQRAWMHYANASYTSFLLAAAARHFEGRYRECEWDLSAAADTLKRGGLEVKFLQEQRASTTPRPQAK